MKYVLTSYREPDMDGVSCAYGYSEYLNKMGKAAGYYLEGRPKNEVEIVCNKFKISLGSMTEGEARNKKYIIVDTNLFSDIPSFIDCKDIVEIVDHHIAYQNIQMYENATIQIEQVGAAATLVVEKYMENKIEISKEAATLLYYGIISNTINLKSNVTTTRDIKAINWLKEQNIDTTKVREIFKEKSIVTNLRRELEMETVVHFDQDTFLVGQIEIVEVEKFLQENKDALNEIFEQVKQEKNIDYLFINAIDIYEGYSTLIVYDEKTANFLEKLMKRKIHQGNNKLESIIMRKQFFAKIEEFKK